MTDYLTDLEILLNRTIHPDGRLAIFSRIGESRYQEGDELESVWTGEVAATSNEHALALAFGMFNRGAPDFVGDDVYPHRSLSVGDVAVVNGIRYSCEPVGWQRLDEVRA